MSRRLFVRPAHDIRIRLASVLLLAVGGGVDCSSDSSAQHAATDALVTYPDGGHDSGDTSCDAACVPATRPDASGARVACGTTSCDAAESYCEIHTGGGAGGQSGSGPPTTVPMTYRCLPFPTTCPSHSCACSLGCDRCSEDDAGRVTVMCMSV